MNIIDVLSPNKIRLRLAVASKPQLLDQLVGIVYECGEVLDFGMARRAVHEREERLATGIGHGIALPHAKTNAVRATTAALVTLQEPIDYGAIDGIPVDIALLVLGRENDVRTHLQLLGKISQLIATDAARETFRQTLLQAASPGDAYAFFQRLCEGAEQ